MFEREVSEKIKDLYSSGTTQEEIARRFKMSRSYVRDMQNGKQPPKNLTVDTLMKVFPHAKITLDGSSAIVTAQQNSGNMVGVNHGTVNGDCISAVIDKILDDPELTAEEKVKFVKAVKR